MKAYELRWNGLTQILLQADLEVSGTREAYMAILPEEVGAVYSDPPWNPGNATYWRTHAGTEPCRSYDRFLDAWAWVAAQCQLRGASVVMVEQSVNKGHQEYLFRAVERAHWRLPYHCQWEVLYGSSSKRLPNALLYWGELFPLINPTGLFSEAVTIRAFAAMVAQGIGGWVCDPCMGKGMTSRMAHAFGMSCVGSELNPKRLEIARNWLKREGYSEREVEL